MISIKPLLSENVKDFMDYALDVIKTMDGAPEHSLEEKAQVNEKLATLKVYLDHVATSYNETTPDNIQPQQDQESFSGTGHS